LKKLLLATGAALLIAGAWYYWSPRAAVRDLRAAAITGDVEALDRLVDFPMVREQLKTDLRTGLRRAVDTGRSTGLDDALTTSFGGMMIDGIVDQAVSPSGIAALVRFGGLDRSLAEERASEMVTRMRYEGPNTFVVTARDRRGAPGDRVSFVMRRRGLSWQLVRVAVPRLEQGRLGVP
jgi:hypothetical protein